MRRAGLLLLIAGVGSLAGGCAMAVVPLGAAGMIAKDRSEARKTRHKRARDVARPAALPAGGAKPGQFYSGNLPPPSGAGGGAPGDPAPPAMQFLYGSGEAAALSYQAYFGLANYIISSGSDRAIGHDLRSVVMAPGSTLDKPIFEPCGDKPLAVVLDIDETSVLNLGFEADAATGVPYDQARWDAWEASGGRAVAPVPGVLDMAKAAQAEHVAIVFNSNRSAAHADQTTAMLTGLGLGPALHGDTLWLQGDAGSTGGGKDARRWAIAKKYCVIAMAGDQLGDFSDLFNAPGQSFDQRRASAGGRYASVLWGRGWFMLPNPVYGTALKGAMGEVFPLDKRWTGPSDIKEK